MLKGSEPSTATMALLTANGDSLYKGLSSFVPFICKKRGLNVVDIFRCQCSPPTLRAQQGDIIISVELSPAH